MNERVYVSVSVEKRISILGAFSCLRDWKVLSISALSLSLRQGDLVSGLDILTHDAGAFEAPVLAVHLFRVTKR